jgi:hypothetical protein
MDVDRLNSMILQDYSSKMVGFVSVVYGTDVPEFFHLKRAWSWLEVK